MIRGLLTGGLVLGMLAVPGTAQAKANPALKLSASSITVSEKRIAKVAVRCISSKTCRGTLQLRVAGKSSAKKTYAVASKKSKTYSVTLTAAQFSAIPRGGKKASTVRIAEKAPKKISTRSVGLTLKRSAAPKPTPTVPTPTVPTTPPGPALSKAYTDRNWTPTAFDTCPASLHRTYSVVGPDGKLYPDLASGNRHRSRHGQVVHVRSRARRRSGDVGHLRLGHRLHRRGLQQEPRCPVRVRV
ncbi:hypothetical protein [Aeromicrobium sp. UC242_57]|uniref:hypothetical protein n=1 Tax=Aeromicrobium sp. UC242_57 TaxID=3374624 RepID=UPI003792F359